MSKSVIRRLALQLHERSRHNKDSIMLSSAGICGCFYCKSIFKSGEIEEWADEGGDTALCPRCGIDSVILEPPILEEGSFLDLLEEMNSKWFSS